MRTTTGTLHRMAGRLTAAVLVGLSAACGGGGDSTGPAAPTSVTGIRVANATNLSAFYIRVRPCSGGNWSSDLLGADILFHGDEKTFPLASGCYDVLAESNPDYNKVRVFEDVSVPAGQTVSLTLDGWTDAE